MSPETRFSAVFRALYVLLALSAAPGTARLANAQDDLYLYALLTDEVFPDPLSTPVSEVEVVDLATRQRVRTLPLGQRSVTSLAVSPDQLWVYVADTGNGEILEVDAVDGTIERIVPSRFPVDLLLSPDGSTLYAAIPGAVIAVDTQTMLVSEQLSTGSDTPFALALSPDGTTLGAVTTGGGSDPGLYLVEPGTLSLVQRVPITNPGEPDNCGTLPTDATFTDTGLALLWDPNCDNLYQVDVASQTQNTAGTIRLERDIGVFVTANHVLSYSVVTARAYVTKESQELAVLDPSVPAGFTLGGFAAFPIVAELAPDETNLFMGIVSGAPPVTLDRYDAQSATFERSIYTFDSPRRYVVDLRVLPTPNVIIDGCDTGVTNLVLPEGTLSEIISECATSALNHGDFVSCVTHLTNELRKAGLITNEESKAIRTCAAGSSLP